MPHPFLAPQLTRYGSTVRLAPRAPGSIGRLPAYPDGSVSMVDLLLLGVALAFFAASWGFVLLCERLSASS